MAGKSCGMRPHNGPDPENQVDEMAGSRAIEKSGGPGDCCTPSNALNAVRGAASEAARSQGGTELTAPPSGSKGNSGQIGLGREAVNSDPQGFRWTDVPREDRDGG
jgi:hypothetical protein